MDQISLSSMIPALITATAIILSAAVAIILALWNNSQTSKASKVLTTFNVLNERGWDKDYITARSLFITAKKGGDGAAFLKAVEEDPNPTDTGKVDQERLTMESAVQLIMNDYERTFIAIEKNALDISFFKNWHFKTVIDDFEKTEVYVEWMRARNNNDKIYEVFQRNAKRWKKERDSSSNGANI